LTSDFGGAYTPAGFFGVTMDQATIGKIIATLKAEAIGLVVTLPEEPTSALTETSRRDPYFTSVTMASDEEFSALVKPALEATELGFFVLKSASGRTPLKDGTRLLHGRPML
jgi:hypothetical protein